MRVLHLDSGREMRGGQWQVLALLQGLGSGHTLLAAGDGPLFRTAQERGVDVEPLSALSLGLSAPRYELVHAHDARSHTWAAALTGSRLVVSRRVAFPVGKSWVSRWKYARPSRFLAVSSFVKQTLLEAGIPDDRISVVYDGVAMPAGVASGERIVAVNTMDPMKGRDLLDEASRLAGITVQYSDDLMRDLPGAALFVYITRSEGLGSAALLSMAWGVPVVASRVGGLPEIVKHGSSGILTENEPSAIAEAIRMALDQRAKLAINARRSVEEGFTTAHMVQRTREAYERVLGD